MRRALLLYNPESGRRRRRRSADVEAAAIAFQQAGVEPVVELTRGPGSALVQSREAIARGCDAVIVCGGDGTVNEVLPAVVGTEIALGVVPLGTANGLANDLGIPGDPTTAARVLASAPTRSVAVPRIDTTRPGGERDARYWIMGAGIGADAYMVYRLTLAFKQRWGMAAYYAESTRQWLTHDFPLFTAEFRQGSGDLRREQVSQVLAIRIAWFGGLLGCLAPGADLIRPDFQLVLFKTRSRMAYLRYMAGVWTGRVRSSSHIEILPSTECRCFLADDSIDVPSAAPSGPPAIDRRPPMRIYSESDGELLGTLPVALSMSDKTVNLLFPRAAHES
jgi:diacylglycerol kinase family enzyme